MRYIKRGRENAYCQQRSSVAKPLKHGHNNRCRCSQENMKIRSTYVVLKAVEIKEKVAKNKLCK